jgi:hypothetical protein
MKRMKTTGVALALCVTIGLAAMAAGDQDARAASLLRGWNNVSYLGAARPPSEALSSISGQFSSVYRWNPATQSYQLYAPGIPSFVNTLTQLNPGDAIWVNYTQDSGQLNTGEIGSGGSSAPTSGKIAIAASTFMPMNDLAIYEKSFNQLNAVGTDAASQRYYAPVILPQGAAITTMTAAFEGSGDAVKIRLDYTPIANGDQTAQVFKLVEVLSSAGSSPQTANAFAHVVDNGANVYFLVVDLIGGSASKLKGVSVSFNY